MSQAEGFLAQFKQEMASTRKTLARVPFEKADWAPNYSGSPTRSSPAGPPRPERSMKSSAS